MDFREENEVWRPLCQSFEAFRRPLQFALETQRVEYS